MIIYPAIDLIGGKCVRLKQGNYDNVTVYHDDPVAMARLFVAAGAAFIHMVDLEGARNGVSQTQNSSVIKAVAQNTGLDVQTGGGIRSINKIEDYIENGVKRVILGTSAVEDPNIVKQAVSKYGDKIVIGIDARGGKVAISGWESESELDAIEFALRMRDLGIKNIIYTDISKDGMLSGPNLKATEIMARALNNSASGNAANVIASGGVSCLQDVIDLKSTGASGVIIGKAIYEGKIDLKEAISVCQQ